MNHNHEALTPAQEALLVMRDSGLLDCDDQQFETCFRCPISGLSREISETNETMSAIVAASLPARPFAAEAKARIKANLMAELDREEEARTAPKPPPAEVSLNGFTFNLAADNPWVSLPVKGVRMRQLSDGKESGTAVVLLDLAAGCSFPDHHHRGFEQGFVLSGDLRMEDRLLRAGDFFAAAPDTDHHDLFSESGCQALIITSSVNYPRHVMRGLGAIQRWRDKLRSLVSR